MRCPECHAPVIVYDDTGESACSEDASHDVDEPVKEPFALRSDRMADWALAKLAVAEQNLDRIAAHAERMVQDARDFQRNASRKFQADADFFRMHLAAYYEKVAPSLGKRKTYELVNGEITSRQGSEVVDVAEGFCEWAQANGRDDLVSVKVAPDKAAIKAALKAGEELPGARLERKPDEVRVKATCSEQPVWLPMPDESEAA